MKLLFWNVQRLGAATDQDRIKALKTVYQSIKPDLVLLCELTQGCQFPQPQNLTYRKDNPYQLCYGCLDSGGNDVVLDKYTPAATDAYKAAGFKGGNNFTLLADRAVGAIGPIAPHNLYLYVIHAPASNEAKKVMSFLACDLNANNPNPWLVIGDFNVEPDDLKAAKVGIQLSDLILPPSEPTHIGNNKDTTLDYALTNINGASISRIRCSPRFHGSDHYPILVTLPT